MFATSYILWSRMICSKKVICPTYIFYSKATKTNRGDITNFQKCIGQPTHFSHPHLIKEDEITPNIRKEEFRTRRQVLLEKIKQFSCSQFDLKKDFVVIFPSASKKYMSDKIPYFFRQNTEFLYLTGCQEPDSCLVLTSHDSENDSSILFVQGTDVHSELWDGPRICPSDVDQYFGIQKGLPMEELENYLRLYLKSNPETFICMDEVINECPTPNIRLKIARSRAKNFKKKKLKSNGKSEYIILLIHTDTKGEELQEEEIEVKWEEYDIISNVQTNVDNTIRCLLKARGNTMLESPKFFVEQQRLLKSPAEIELMRRSCQVASEAIISTIKYSRPGNNEYEIFAKVDYECRKKGAEYLAYPPVVAGGRRANVIHYITNNQIVTDGEMVLMDVGCEYHGYSSDITRTWPIGGKFTNEQRELYEAVLETQLEIIELCRNFPSLDSLFDSMCRILGKKLQEIGLIPKLISNEALIKYAYQFCPHHVSHYLGMDVHDTPSITRNISVRPGMIITIEPGVYIHENNKSVPTKYRGIGIRIEDDILITDSGPEVLTKNCHKDVVAIERIASDKL